MSRNTRYSFDTFRKGIVISSILPAKDNSVNRIIFNYTTLVLRRVQKHRIFNTTPADATIFNVILYIHFPRVKTLINVKISLKKLKIN